MAKMRKVLALLLTLSMLMGTLSTAVFAAEGDQDADTTAISAEVIENNEDKENNEEPQAPAENEGEEEPQAPELPVGDENEDNGDEEPAGDEPVDQKPETEEPEAEEPVTVSAALEAAPMALEEELTDAQKLQNAINQGGIVTLEEDVTLDTVVTVAEDVNVTLDLNGCTITTTGNGGRKLVNNGTLVITGTGTIQSNGKEAYGLIDNYGELTIEGGTYIDNAVGDGASVKNRENATLKITGGIFNGNPTDTSYYEGKTDNGNARVASNGTLIVTGGTFSSGSAATPVFKIFAGDAEIGAVEIDADSAPGIEVVGGCTTLKNTTINVANSNSTGYLATAAAVSNGATLNIDGGKYGSVSYGVYVFSSGGTINVKGNPTVIGNVDAIHADAVEGATATVNVESGDFTGDIHVGGKGEKNVAITGGSFPTIRVPDEFLAPTVTQEDDGSVVPLTAETGVAQVGNKYYRSLEAAITAADEGETVKLLCDVKAGADIFIQKAITLDLDGHTITNSGFLYLGGFEGVAVVKNGTVIGQGVNSSAILVSKASVKLEGMDVTASGEGGYAVQVGQSAKGYWGSAEIVDCTITGTADKGGVGVAIYGPYGNDDEIGDLVTTLKVSGNTNISGNYYGIVGNGKCHSTAIEIGEGVNVTGEYMGLYHPQVGTAITSGNITGKQECGIEIRAGELTVLGGTVTSGADSFDCKPEYSGTTTVGAAIAIAQHTTKRDISVTISGGEFKGVKALNESNPQENDPAPKVALSVTGGNFQGDIATVDVEKFISGGTFSQDVSNYVVEGSAAYTEDSETWTIVPEEGSVAAIGSVGYSTFQGAIEAAKDGETVTLIADKVTGATGKDKIELSKEITLDLNGKTLTNSRFNIEKGGKLTIEDTGKDGELVYTDAYGIFLIGGELVVNGGYIHGSLTVDIAIGANRATSVKEGAENTCTINGGKIESSAAAIFWNIGKLTLNGGELVGATGIEIRSGSLEVPANSTVKVTGKGDSTVASGLAYVSDDGFNFFGAGVVVDSYEATTANIAGGEFTGYYGLLDHYTGEAKTWKDTITVTGGTFTADTGIAMGALGDKISEQEAVHVDETGVIIAISGGAFSTKVPANYCATGFVPVQSGEGYGVKDALALSQTTLSMTVGYRVTSPVTLTAETTATGEEIIWNTSNEAVATVVNGVVTAVGTGTANITATVNDVSATCVVTVTNTSRPSSGGSSFRPSTTTPVEEDLQDEDTPLVEKPFLFEDVAESEWFYGAVKYAFDNGLMEGTSDARFNPYMLTNRGMIVTMLHRLEGEPEAAGSQFLDVAEGNWYTNAVVWAVSTGVAKGYDDSRFGPEDEVSREQLALFLFRYAQMKGYDVTGRADLGVYVDSEATSDWALDAMRWAVNEGILKGRGDNVLDPAGSATRSEAAEMVMNFSKKFQAEPETEPEE